MLRKSASLIIGFAIVGLFQNCSDLQNHVQFQNLPQLPDLKLEPGKFTSCHEIKQWQERTEARRVDLLANTPVAVSADGALAFASSPSSRPTTSITNRQEVDVDEPDVVKADDLNLYYARSQSVEVISKSSYQVLQSIRLPELMNIQLFLDAKRLFVFGQDASRKTTQIKSFDIANGRLNVGSEINLTGYFSDARLASGELVFISTNWVNLSHIDFKSHQVFNVPCSEIDRPLLEDFDFTLTTIHKVQTSTMSLRSLGVFGQVSSIYMTKDNLYLASNGYNWLGSDPRLMSNELYQSEIIRKIDVRSGRLAFSAVGSVRGHIKDQWSFHERANNLYVATTLGANGFFNRNQIRNQISVLRQTPGTRHLKTVGQSVDFGMTEEIKSVRYVGDMAYVVTFRRMDPLFAFDLANGDRPELLGELEIPGFSAYLHPVATGRLLGLGYSSESTSGQINGVQVSLFDVANPKIPRALLQSPIGGAGSSSPAIFDHHAFHYSDGIAAFPVSLITNGNLQNFNGALIYAVSDTLKEVARVSHSAWRPVACFGNQDVSRIVKSGRYLITLSPLGIKVVDPLKNYGTAYAAPFKELELECTPRFPDGLSI